MRDGYLQGVSAKPPTKQAKLEVKSEVEYDQAFSTPHEIAERIRAEIINDFDDAEAVSDEKADNMPSSNSIDAAVVGPHPSFIEIAKAYVFQPTIQECLDAAGVSEAKDDSIRLQGVAWIDSTRKYMKL